MATRFFSARDQDLFDRVSDELLGDLRNEKDGIINQNVVVYQLAVQETKTNMYGEAAAGKIYKPGVEVACTISADDFDYNTDEFGPDLRQNAVFSFLREQLIDAGLRPELGDIIDWNYAYFEVNAINVININTLTCS